MTSSYLTWKGEFGSIVVTNLLGNFFIHHDAPHEMHPYFAKSLNSPIVQRTFHFPFGIQTFLVLFMLEMISFGTQKRLTPLLACLFTLMTTTLSFFFFKRDRVWMPSCPPCWCRYWRACLFAFCFSISSLLLPHSSPYTHRTCGLPCGTRSKPRFVLHQASSLP